MLKKFKVPILEETILVHIGYPPEKYHNKYSISLDNLAEVHDTTPIFVWFKEQTFNASVVAHEAIHIKNILFKQCSIKHDFENDEFEAYLVEYIVKEIEKIYKSVTR